MIRTPKSSGEVAGAAREILQRFATRAYRRPVNEGELAKLLKFVDLAMQNGDRFDRGIELAVQAALVSPQFLFRVELGSPGPSAAGTNKGSANGGHLIGQYELASRLSYFLWSSMPDDELFRLAALDQLRSGDTLDAPGSPNDARPESASVRGEFRRPVAPASQPQNVPARTRNDFRPLTSRSDAQWFERPSFSSERHA